MRAIYKYPVPLDDRVHKYWVPAGAQIRHVAQQQNCPCIWAEVKTDAPQEERGFRVFGTGFAIPDGFVYRGTAMDGAYVWHVYELL